jgi:mRNA interferase RelE/StbE
VAYTVVIRDRAERRLQRIPEPLRSNIRHRIDRLADNPRPSGAQPLKGIHGLWRLRVGNWRVVYVIDDEQGIVDIRLIGPRGEVYRGL